MNDCYTGQMSSIWRRLLRLMVKLGWFFGFTLSVINGEGCDKLRIENTMFHESLEGSYTRLTTVCANRSVYKQSDGNNYLFYRDTSPNWRGWMVGNKKCFVSDGLRVESDSYYPENVKEVWQEWYFENWYYSKLIKVQCNKVSSTTLIGVAVLGFLIVLVIAFVVVRCRAMMQRRRMAPQPIPRTQVATVSSTRTAAGSRMPSNMVAQPRYAGPYAARPPHPHGALRHRAPHFAPPPMRPGFGHGPMMPGYRPNPNMPQYNQRPMIPPGYVGYNGPMAPAYPDVIGPPPPYKPPSAPYLNTDLGYPPPEAVVTDPPQIPQQDHQQQQQQQQQQQLQSQQQQQQQLQQQSSVEEKEAEKEDERDEARQMHSVQSMRHGHGDGVENEVTATVAD